MSEALPKTPLDRIASALRRQNEENGSMSYAPAKMLDNDSAVEFQFKLYGQKFTALAWMKTYDDSMRNRSAITVVLYDPDTDVHALEDCVRQTNYIAIKHLNERDMDDVDVFEDTQHMLATALGYFTRYLLDGREYEFRARSHREPKIDSVAE